MLLNVGVNIISNDLGYFERFLMKSKLIFIFIIFIYPKIYSQDQGKFQDQIDSLGSIKTGYENKIMELNIFIKQIEDKKSFAKIERFGGSKYTIPANSIIQIRDKANSTGRLIFIPIRGEIITLIDFDDNNHYWLVSFNENEFGYVKDVDIEQNTKINNYKKHLFNINYQIALKPK
jgi:hypothetical protein